MDRSVHTIASGLKALLDGQRVAAANIANAATPGFRRDLDAVEAKALGGSGSRIQAAARDAGIDLSPGAAMTTGNPLDVALDGDAMLAVAGADGVERYTRRGDLRPDADGTLRTGDGFTALGEAGPLRLPPGARDVRIAIDGTLSIASGDGVRTAVARVKLVTPPDPGALRRGGDGALVSPAGPLPADPDARLTAGALEGANGDPVGEMVGILERARRFELQIKLLGDVRAMDEAGASTMRLDR